MRNGRSLPKALIAWSSGKDSAWALHEARRAGRTRHCRRLDDGDRQLRSASACTACARRCCARSVRPPGYPQIIVRIPYPCPNEIYEREMAAAIADAKARGVTHIIFGDLFLAGHPRLSREAACRYRHHAGVSALAATDGGSGARHDRRRRRGASCCRRSEETAGVVCRQTFRCGVAVRISRPASTPAARTANFILSCRPGRCWRAKFRCGSARRSSATALPLRILFRHPEVRARSTSLEG